MAEGICSVAGCGRGGRIIRGWCEMHYRRWNTFGDPGPAQPFHIRRDVDARFAAYHEKLGPVSEARPDLGPCWVWTRSLNGDGYGHLRVGKNIVGAHRWSYERHVGPVPDGYEVDHLCLNRRCVNPAHLEAVTKSVNSLRRWVSTPTHKAATA